MSNFKRQAIVSLAAIAGAQLSAIVLSSQPAQTSSECLQWAAEGINHAIRKPADPLDGRNYWENDVWADSQPQASATPSAVAPQPLARTQAPPVPSGVGATSAPITIAPSETTAMDGATTQSIWAKEQRLPRADEMEGYNSLRRMGMVKRGASAPQQRGHVGL